jgi:internalin A
MSLIKVRRAWLSGGVLALLFLCLGCAKNVEQEPPSAAGSAPAEPAAPLPADVVAAWTGAGATGGWVVTNPADGWLLFHTGVVAEPGALPAFKFPKWRAGALDKLPQPAQPFGLDLNLTKVQDADLQELAGLKNLRWLNLCVTKTSDAGLKELAPLQGLQALDLNRTAVGGVGLKELAALHDLYWLNLSAAKVTDAGLKEVAGLRGLRWLNVYGTPVTDAGLKELAGLKNLQTLFVGKTRVTNAGVAELQKALPALRIVR